VVYGGQTFRTVAVSGIGFGPMIEPVHLQNFFMSFFSAAMVILAGALYAMLFAWSRLHKQPRLMPLAYGAYAILFVSVLALAHATNLNGYWQILVGVLLVGYLLAPHGMWHLCVGTHGAEHEGDRGSTDPLRTKT
jgi:hypothetical protein